VLVLELALVLLVSMASELEQAPGLMGLVLVLVALELLLVAVISQ
jgi:hypothetical protein